jgi:hypothetical protein
MSNRNRARGIDVYCLSGMTPLETKNMGCSYLAAAIAAASMLFASTIQAQSINAVPEVGTTDAGLTSRAFVNVTANDTVNGTPAALGTSGNATISKSGAWRAGIGLNTTTGAVTTTYAVLPGTYSLPYQLCDLHAPPDCSIAVDTVSVITAAIVPQPDSGNAVSGIASQPIPCVAANDMVNGAPAVLGASGNSHVSKSGTWPTGLTLNAAGAISTTVSLAAGTYHVSYELCDNQTPATCAATTDTVVVTAGYPEIQVSTVPMIDIEFDWGRDGVYCASCNFGQGNARYNWTDKLGNLWVGHIDPSSGAFTPTTGNNELADDTAFFSAVFGNGPEWAFSTQGGQVISQLVYTRYPPGLAEVVANAGAAFTTQTPNGWTPNFFPGTTPASAGGTLTTYNPSASQCNSDPDAFAYFYDNATPQDVFWEPVTTAPGTAPALTPFGSFNNHVSGGKPSIRWVACTHVMVFASTGAPDGSGNSYSQVYWYDTDNQVLQQLTFDSTSHTEAYMFSAPEFNDSFVLYTISNGLVIQIYVQTDTASNGAPIFTLVNQIQSPDPAEPYMIGTEPFINCTPTCQSYIFMRLQSPGSYQALASEAPNGVAVTTIDPAQPMFKILASQAAAPKIQRIDLEYYITPNGPYLYYDRSVVTTSNTQFAWGNRYYIDMQLGAPSGPCMGSSAEGGLMPGC